VSDTRDPETDQPLPIHNANEYVQEMVITDLHARMQHGIRKYGTALQAGNGRDMLQDAYEEVLDLAVYLRGEIEERRTGTTVAVDATALIYLLEHYEMLAAVVDHEHGSHEADTAKGFIGSLSHPTDRMDA